MSERRQIVMTVVALCFGMTILPPATADSASSVQAQIQELQKQVDVLTQELAEVTAGTNPEAQQQAMQSHWSMMQQHMQSMRTFPGMGPSSCSDWMMMSPSMMGGGMMDGCWNRGTGMMGAPMSGWAPPNETPSQYQQRMQTMQREMHNQMAAIAAETNPAKREALMRQHYETMYRGMQTMRGMGWMWNRGSSGSLPDAGSPGATLEARYCSQCHAAPLPDIHTAKEWAEVTGRMQQHISDQSASTGDVSVPSPSEMATIVEYLKQHARAGS